MRALRAAVWFVLGIAAACSCSDRTYATTFTCVAPGSAACPGGETCPTVPLGAGGCEDLPGLFGHASTKVDRGRPPGCIVQLAYANPYFPNDPQTCTCQPDLRGAPVAAWMCGT